MLFWTEGIKFVAQKRKWSSPMPVFKHEQAARSFAGFGRFARRLNLNRAEGVGADADQELSVRRLGHIEAVEQRDGLVGLRSGDVGLSALIAHHAGNEVDGVAIVVRRVGYTRSTTSSPLSVSLRRDSRRIDRRRRFVDVDYFLVFLQTRDADFDRRTPGVTCTAALSKRRSPLFRREACTCPRKMPGSSAASGVVGLAMSWSYGRRLQRDTRARYRDSIFIDDCNRGPRRSLRSSRAGDRKRQEKGTHSSKLLYGGMSQQ